MYENLMVMAVFAFIFSAIAGRVERSAVTGPIVYILFGLIAGPIGLGFLDMDVHAVELRVVADLTLALVLFLDASNADLKTCADMPSSRAACCSSACHCALRWVPGWVP